MIRERSDQAHGCHELVDPLVLRKSVATYLGSWSVSPILRHNHTGEFYRCEIFILGDQPVQGCLTAWFRCSRARGLVQRLLVCSDMWVAVGDGPRMSGEQHEQADRCGGHQPRMDG